MNIVKVNLSYDVPVSKLEAFGKLINQIGEIVKDSAYPQVKERKKRKKRKASKRRTSKVRRETEKWAVDYFKKNEYYPSYEEVAKHFGINYKTAHQRLKRYWVRISKNKKPVELKAA